MECQECHQEFKNFKALCTHVQFKHVKKEYYDKWLRKENEGFCNVCNKPTKFTIMGRGYEKFCSKKCFAEFYSNLMRANPPMKSEKSKQKAIDTNMIRYGVSHNNKRTEIKHQVKETCMQKYGTSNFIQNKIIKDKAKKSREATCMKEHGVKSYLSANDVRNKIKQTCIIKYGVEYVFHNKNILEKAQKSSFKLLRFRDTNIWYQAKYELDFLEKYYDEFPDIMRGPAIKYEVNKQQHMYYPDFYIPSLNLIVECKNSYLANRDKTTIEQKQNATLNEGYNYIMIINKNYQEFSSLFP